MVCKFATFLGVNTPNVVNFKLPAEMHRIGSCKQVQAGSGRTLSRRGRNSSTSLNICFRKVFSSALLKQNLRTIKWIHLKCTIWWVLMNAYTLATTPLLTSNIWNISISQHMEHFYYPTRNISITPKVFLCCSFPVKLSNPTPASSNHSSAFYYHTFIFFRIPYKRNHIVYILLCLAPLTQHNVFEIGLCCLVYHSSRLFIAEQ